MGAISSLYTTLGIKMPPLAGRHLLGLRASNVRGGRALSALDNLEVQRVTDFERVKGDANEIFRVKEKVLRLAFASDETESLLFKSFDSACHMIESTSLVDYLRNSTAFLCLLLDYQG
jgi:hypothetical protein